MIDSRQTNQKLTIVDKYHASRLVYFKIFHKACRYKMYNIYIKYKCNITVRIITYLLINQYIEIIFFIHGNHHKGILIKNMNLKNNCAIKKKY